MEGDILIENNSRQFRVAILGAGNISAEHADTLRWLPNTKVIAVCDLYQERANALSKKYEIPEVYTSADEMLQKIQPDVVHILSPPTEHVRLAIKCLEAGSNVFVEKPIGITVAECNDLLHVATAKGLTVGVNHNMVYHPVVQHLIEKIREHRLGRIIHVNIACSMPPSKLSNIPKSSFILQAPQNPLLEWAVHPLSVIHRLIGRVEKAGALVSADYNIANGGGSFYSTWQSSLQCNRGTAQLLLSVGHGFDYMWMDVLGEDAFAHLDFKNDSMLISEYTPYRPVVGGLYEARIKSKSLFKSAIRNMKNYIMAGLSLPVPAASLEQAEMRNSIRAFYGALSSGTKPSEGIEQGTAVVEYCEQIYESAFFTNRKEMFDGQE
jgi:predicted dehydrogenase